MAKIELEFKNGVVDAVSAVYTIAEAMGKRRDVKNNGNTFQDPEFLRFSYRGADFRVEHELTESEVRKLINTMASILNYEKVEVKTFEI